VEGRPSLVNLGKGTERKGGKNTRVARCRKVVKEIVASRKGDGQGREPLRTRKREETGGQDFAGKKRGSRGSSGDCPLYLRSRKRSHLQ